MNKRQQILSATQRLIQTKGLARTTTKAIARTARCSEGSIFRHFKDKEALFLAVLLENLPEFKETFVRERVGQGPIRYNLEIISRAAIRYFEKLIPLAASVFADAELLARHREQAGEGESRALQLDEEVVAYVEGEQRRGQMNARLAPRSVAALLLGACFQRVFFRQFFGSTPLEEKQFVLDLVAAMAATVEPRRA
jgi:AcrR family transcriptional regulator